MSDETLPPIDPRLVELVRDAIARGVPRLGQDEVVDRPPVITGRDAAGFTARDTIVIREIVRQIVVEQLRERKLLSEMEIRAVAKEIAHTIAEQAVAGIRADLRTESQIEAIVVDKLREIAIRADDEHLDETRETFSGLQRGHKRRSEMTGDFMREVIKALAGYGSVGIAGGLVAWMMMKGGAPH